MAKKPVKGAGLEIPVSFGNVSFGDHTASVSCKASRSNLSVTQADRSLCGKRLTGTILARPEGSGSDQPGLLGTDGDLEVAGVFDVDGFGVKTVNISFTVSFSLKDIDRATFSEFAKRNGRIEISEIASIDDEEESDE